MWEWCLLITLCVPLGAIFFVLYLNYGHAGRLMDKIPAAVKGYPLIGNAMISIKSPEHMWKFTRGICENHGYGITKITGLNYRYINIYQPADIEKILSNSRYNTKGSPYTFIKPWLGNGLLTSNGIRWLRRRKILTPAFHFNILRQFSYTFATHTAVMIQDIEKRLSLEDGTNTVDLVPIVSKTTLAIMCETSMGTSIHDDLDSISEKYFSALRKIVDDALYRMLRVWLYPSWLYALTKSSRNFLKTVNDLHTFTDKIVKDKRQKLKENIEKSGEITTNELADDSSCARLAARPRLGLLDLLLKNELEGQIDHVGIREEVDTFLFEGHDTTAMALTFLMMSIANEPNIQQRLYEEQREIFGYDDVSPPDMDQLIQMKYLDCCIKETLRLYPSVHYISRYLTEDVMLGGYKVPAGTICNIHVFDIHRREDLFPNATKFDPDRFRPGSEGEKKMHTYSYIPFSAGPRNCIGQKFSMLEMKTIMSGVLRKFSLHPVTRPEDLEFSSDLILKTSHPILVTFCKRS